MDTQTNASFGAKTFQTWATNWTDCTNTTFSKVHRHWGSNNAMQKEVSDYNKMHQKPKIGKSQNVSKMTRLEE